MKFLQSKGRAICETNFTPTKILDDFLVFNSDRNQLKWTGSFEQLESFIFQRLNVLKEDIQSKSNNGTCMVWPCN